MKKSKILNGLLVVAVCAAMILPSIASANYGQEKQEKNHPKKATTTPGKIIPKKVSFCEGLGAWETKSLEKITARDKKLEADWQKWVKKLADQRIAYDSRLESERAQADKVRMEKYIKLEGKASTTAEKEAVALYKKTIEDAIKARRAAVDAAIKTYRAEVDKAAADRNTALDNALSVLKTDYQAAIAKAKTDCTATSTVSIQLKVKKDFNTAIKAADKKYSAAKRAIDKIRTHKFYQVRHDSIGKAQSDYNKLAKNARISMNKVFKRIK